MYQWRSNHRRGTTIVDTIVIIAAFAFTAIVFSVVLINLGILERDNEAETVPVVQEVNASAIFDEYNGMTI